MTEELRRFITVNNSEAAAMATWENTLERHSVVEPKFSDDFPEAAAREGADELTVRRGDECTQRSSISTTNVEDHRWAPPLVDDSYAICHAIYKSVERKVVDQEVQRGIVLFGVRHN